MISKIIRLLGLELGDQMCGIFLCSSFWERAALYELWGDYLDMGWAWIFLDWFSFWHGLHFGLLDLVYLIKSII